MLTRLHVLALNVKSVIILMLNIVYEHLVCSGMNPLYKDWVLHDEVPSFAIEFEMSDKYKTYRDTHDQFKP